MEVLVLQVFVSLMLVLGAVVLLAFSVKQSDHEHAARLSLLPLESDHPLQLQSQSQSQSQSHTQGPPTRATCEI